MVDQVAPSVQQQLSALTDLQSNRFSLAVKALSEPRLIAPRAALRMHLQDAGLTASEARMIVDVGVGFAGAAIKNHAYPDHELGKNLAKVSGHPEEERIELARRLDLLVHSPAIAVYSRARRKYRDRRGVFLRADFEIDVRYVFGESSKKTPVAAVPTQHLRITYSDNLDEEPSETSEFVLDAADLVDLRAAIDEAIVQVESVEKVLSKGGVQVWNSQLVRDPDA